MCVCVCVCVCIIPHLFFFWCKGKFALFQMPAAGGERVADIRPRVDSRPPPTSPCNLWGKRAFIDRSLGGVGPTYGHSAVSSHSSVQFSSVAQSCPTLFDPMNCSMPGLPVHHQPLEFTETHAHRVGDAIQPSHPLLSPSPPAPSPSQHQGLFQ